MRPGDRVVVRDLSVRQPETPLEVIERAQAVMADTDPYVEEWMATGESVPPELLHAAGHLTVEVIAAGLRLHEEVVRLTRDRERLTGYVRAALPLSRDALTHIVEDRPEEAAQTLFRVICALASAVERGADQHRNKGQGSLPGLG